MRLNMSLHLMKVCGPYLLCGQILLIRCVVSIWVIYGRARDQERAPQKMHLQFSSILHLTSICESQESKR